MDHDFRDPLLFLILGIHIALALDFRDLNLLLDLLSRLGNVVLYFRDPLFPALNVETV